MVLSRSVIMLSASLSVSEVLLEAVEPRLPRLSSEHCRLCLRLLRDEATLLPWLKTNAPELIKVTEAADWAALKKRLIIAPDGATVATEDGEIVPGVKAIQRPEVFRVEMKEETGNE